MVRPRHEMGIMATSLLFLANTTTTTIPSYTTCWEFLPSLFQLTQVPPKVQKQVRNQSETREKPAKHNHPSSLVRLSLPLPLLLRVPPSTTSSNDSTFATTTTTTTTPTPTPTTLLLLLLLLLTLTHRLPENVRLAALLGLIDTV